MGKAIYCQSEAAIRFECLQRLSLIGTPAKISRNGHTVNIGRLF